MQGRLRAIGCQPVGETICTAIFASSRPANSCDRGNTCFRPISVVGCSRPALFMAFSGQASLKSGFIYDVLGLEQASLLDFGSGRSNIVSKHDYGEVARGT